MVRLFLCGDVMIGRGIDQILAFPSDPKLYEDYVKDAREYIRIAETVNGPIPKPVNDTYIWGEALEQFERHRPDVGIINLETSVTTSAAWEEKGINYKMNPANISCLKAARVDCCALANNHILDWGTAGLIETVATLRSVGLQTAGAGRSMDEATHPAIFNVNAGRVLVFALGVLSSGIPTHWAATPSSAGVNFLANLSAISVAQVKEQIEKFKKANDVAVVSIHWGGNWGYRIPFEHRRFAQALIDEASVDVVYGHSSHHVLGIEVHHGKLIFYGCGDLLTDYEGIRGHSLYRSDLSLMYFADLAVKGKLVSLKMVPMQTRKFRLSRASRQDAVWLKNVLDREGVLFGTQVTLDQDQVLHLHWKSEHSS